MVGRKVLGEELLEGGGALFARFAFLVVGARVVVEVARAVDVGVLQ